jgi:hypothetical protein
LKKSSRSSRVGSYGNALKGTPGSKFNANRIQFTVLDEKYNKERRQVECGNCHKKMRRDKAKDHTH